MYEFFIWELRFYQCLYVQKDPFKTLGSYLSCEGTASKATTLIKLPCYLTVKSLSITHKNFNLFQSK